MVRTNRLDSDVKESVLLELATRGGAAGRKWLRVGGVIDCRCEVITRLAQRERLAAERRWQCSRWQRWCVTDRLTSCLPPNSNDVATCLRSTSRPTDWRISSAAPESWTGEIVHGQVWLLHGHGVLAGAEASSRRAVGALVMHSSWPDDGRRPVPLCHSSTAVWSICWIWRLLRAWQTTVRFLIVYQCADKMDSAVNPWFSLLDGTVPCSTADFNHGFCYDSALLSRSMRVIPCQLVTRVYTGPCYLIYFMSYTSSWSWSFCTSYLIYGIIRLQSVKWATLLLFLLFLFVHINNDDNGGGDDDDEGSPSK